MDVTDPCMSDLPPKARNYFLACYAVSLVQGDTIQGGTIRSRTLRKYITEATQLFRQRKINTHNIEDTDYVDLIIRTVTKYEQVPKRRNMITDSMMLFLHKQMTTEPLDSATSAIIDWLILGRYTGFRKSEWCQSNQQKYETVDSWMGNPALAFIFSDFEFKTKDENVTNLNPSTDIDLIEHVVIQWRHQKNNDNGQKITYSRASNDPRFCPVLAAIRICLRALRLGV